MYILAIIGTLMLVESLGEIDNSRKNALIKKSYMFITGFMVYRYE
jgi:hypothetical protein